MVKVNSEFMKIMENVEEREYPKDGYVCNAVSGVACHTAEIVKQILDRYDRKDVIKVLNIVHYMYEIDSAYVASEILRTFLIVCGYNDSAALIEKLEECIVFNNEVYQDFIGVFFCDDDISDLLLDEYLKDAEMDKPTILQ